MRCLVPLGQLTILAGIVRHRIGPPRGRVRRTVRQALHLRGVEHARMASPAPRRARRRLRLLRDRGLVLPAAAGWRPAGGETAHGRPAPAAAAGRPRLRPVGAEAADRDRLVPRRHRHLNWLAMLWTIAAAGRSSRAREQASGERGGGRRADRPRRRPARAPAPPESTGTAGAPLLVLDRVPQLRPGHLGGPPPPHGPNSPPGALSRPLVGSGVAALDRRRDRWDRPR